MEVDESWAAVDQAASWVSRNQQDAIIETQ
jgi:hypothetical protein